MTVACIVAARMTSTRLPGKMMLSLGGEPCIRHVLRRCQAIEGVDVVVCAVPVGSISDPIKREARKLEVHLVTGDEHDVLSRYHRAAYSAKADVIMRVTGDCPEINPDICARVLSLMGDGTDYASNVWPRSFSRGHDCEVFTLEALERAWLKAVTKYDREHVTSWMQRNLRCLNLEGDGDTELNLCLDTLDDYLFLSERMA